MESTAEKVVRALVQVAHTDEVVRNPDIGLFDADILDSLATVELMVALSDEFGVEISPASVDRAEWDTPRKIVAYIEGLVGR